jgi:hypothetical protein
MTDHTGILTAVESNAAPDPLDLRAPMTLDEAGLRLDLVVQLITKILHFAGELSGVELAERLGLSFPAIEPAIDVLKAQHLCEIVGGTNVGPPSYRYRISTLGRDRAMTFLASNKYTGIAPVPIAQYRAYMNAFQAACPIQASRPLVRKAFSHLVLTQRVLDQLGPAVNAGHSLFVYGPPGNGKTVVSQAIRNLLTGEIRIPHALDVDGQIIQVFDPVNHEPIPEDAAGPGLEAARQVDRRWARCNRPLVTVGGELVLESLELAYNPVAGFYRAPLQLVANGGVLVIDDFGRQRCSPHALLNRWIVPLENRIDHLTLQSGQKVEVPFLVLPVFATNLKPADLVDEAFLRRIHYKVLVESPTEDDFRQIFENVCHERGLAYDRAMPDYLLHTVYPKRGLELRGCHPRDLVDQALSLAKYLDEPRELTPALLDKACDGYFVDEDQGVTRMA